MGRHVWLIRGLSFTAIFTLSQLIGPAIAAPGDTIWTAAYGTPDNSEQGVASVLAPDGSRLYVTGYQGDGLDDDIATVAYNATTGSQVWVSTYDAGDRDRAMAIAVAPDGSRVFVVGISAGAGTRSDYATVAYDAASGEELWVARYDGPAHKRDEPRCIAVSDTQVLVTGGSQSSRDPNYYDVATTAYDVSTGQESWTTRVSHENSSDIANACEAAPDGSAFYVSGIHRTGLFRASAVTIAYSSKSGETLWRHRYDGTRHSWENAYAMMISADGSRVYVAGVTDVTGTEDYLTLAYDASSGLLQWRRIYRSSSYEYAFGLAVAPDGATVLVTGDAGGRIGTLAYSSEGSELWYRAYNPPGWVQFRSIAVAPDGSVAYITGLHEAKASTIAYDVASGASAWKRDDLSVEPHEILAAPNGGVVYITGTNLDTYDYFAAAFEA